MHVIIIISVRIGSSSNVISSFHVDHYLKCFSHCCIHPTCIGFKFKETFSNESDLNCMLMKNFEEDIRKRGEGEWAFYKAIAVSYSTYIVQFN